MVFWGLNYFLHVLLTTLEFLNLWFLSCFDLGVPNFFTFNVLRALKGTFQSFFIVSCHIIIGSSLISCGNNKFTWHLWLKMWDRSNLWFIVMVQAISVWFRSITYKNRDSFRSILKCRTYLSMLNVECLEPCNLIGNS